MLDAAAPTQRYTFAELERLWLDAGGDAAAAPAAAAVALAESSGYSNATNPTDPHGGSFGLWQINGANLNGTAPAQLYDAPTNALFAVQLWNSAGKTFGRDWSTAKSIAGAAPAYVQFLPSAPPPPATTTPAGDPQGAPNPLAAALGAPFAGIQDAIGGWLQAGTIAAAGLALVAGGLAIAAADDGGSPPVVPVPLP